jgi:DNA polymerase-3 subunit delta'
VIVDSADDLNIAAVNALLKSLEEPPESCAFLLVSAAPGRLPVTIRSRCRALRLAPLADDAMRKALVSALEGGDAAMPAAEALDDLLKLAQGSPGAALRFIAGDGADLYRRLLRLLNGMPSADYGAAHELAETLGATGAEERHELFHMMLGGLIARLVAHGVSGEGAFGEEAGLADRLVTSGNLAQWASLWETLQRAKAEADALNLDRNILVLETFFRLEKAARGEAE